MYKLTEKQKKEFEFFKENDDDKVMFNTMSKEESNLHLIKKRYITFLPIIPKN